jgi:hypothetical protein
MSRHKSSGSHFSWAKLFLSILVIASSITIIWIGYLLYTQQLNKNTAIIILAAAIAVLIWDAFLLSRYRVGPGIVFAAFVVTTLIVSTALAFSGVEPFISTKNTVMDWTQSLSTELPTDLNETVTSATSSPAFIHGQVVIADKLQALTPIPIPPNPNGDDQVFWIVKVTFVNRSYSNPIVVQWEKGYEGWVISAGAQVYRPNPVGTSTSDKSFNVEQGHDGEFTFNVIVPRSLTIDEAKICYQGQMPASYGMLSGGDRVLAYDWESKSVITNPLDNFMVAGKNMELRTIASWTGSETNHIEFEADKSPWVVNWRYKIVSKIGYQFDISVITKEVYETYGNVPPLPFLPTVWGPDKYDSIVVPEAGNFVIVVTASGVNWQVKVGTE